MSGATQFCHSQLDRVQYACLRCVLGCMSSTPIYFLLSESGVVPLSTRRTYLTERFVARNCSWTDSPLRSELKLLRQRMERRTRPLQYISKFGIFQAYVKLRLRLYLLHVTRRPNYFDNTWESVNMEFAFRMEIGERLKKSRNPEDVLGLMLGNEFSNSILIYTDGSFNPVMATTGAGFYIPQKNVRFGCTLPGFVSSLTSEIYAIYLPIKFAIHEGLRNVVILTYSQAAINALQYRCLCKHTESNLTHKIAQLVSPFLERFKVVLVWIPGHSGIPANMCADRNARDAARLPHPPRFAASLQDVFGSIKKDAISAAEQRFPFLRGPGRAIMFTGLNSGISDPGFVDWTCQEDQLILLPDLDPAIYAPWITLLGWDGIFLPNAPVGRGIAL